MEKVGVLQMTWDCLSGPRVYDSEEVLEMGGKNVGAGDWSDFEDAWRIVFRRKDIWEGVYDTDADSIPSLPLIPSDEECGRFRIAYIPPDQPSGEAQTEP